MLQDQLVLRYGILIALIAVGLFWRGMLCQQNNEGSSSSGEVQPNIQQDMANQKNEGPSSSGEVQPNIQQDMANQKNEGPSSFHNFGPASTDSANLQHNAIQAEGADNSYFDQNPKVRVVQSNIQQDQAHLQYNDIRANSAKKSKFYQRPMAEKVTQDEANWKDLLGGIVVLIAGLFSAGLFLGGLFLAGMFNRLYNVLAGMYNVLAGMFHRMLIAISLLPIFLNNRGIRE